MPAAAAPGRPSTWSACTGREQARCCFGREPRAGAGSAGSRRMPTVDPTTRVRSQAVGGWHLGNAVWTGAAIGFSGEPRLGVAVARVLRLEPGRARCGAPPLDRRIARRSCRVPAGTPTSAFAEHRRGMPRLCAWRSFTTRPARTLHPSTVGRHRSRDRALPRCGERLERHRLQLPRRPLRPGLRGPGRRHVTQCHRCARRGLQHRLRRDRRDRQLLLDRPARRLRTRSRGSSPGGSTSRTSSRCRRCTLGVRRQRALPARRARAPARGLRSSRYGFHRVPREGRLCQALRAGGPG